MTGILKQLKWESLKKRRKDSRLIMLYKGLKGASSIPTNDLVPPIRHTRNHHSLAFQIPMAGTGYPDKTPPGQNTPCSFWHRWTKHPSCFLQGGHKPPATFDRVDKTPLVSFARWIKSPLSCGQNPPDARLGTSPVVEGCSRYVSYITV